jgi:hypothetical protein
VGKNSAVVKSLKNGTKMNSSTLPFFLQISIELLFFDQEIVINALQKRMQIKSRKGEKEKKGKGVGGGEKRCGHFTN